MNRNAITLGVIIGCAVLAGSVTAAPTASGDQQRRSDLVVQIVEKWGSHVEETYARPQAGWEQAIVPRLNALDADALQRAANAGNFDEMNRIVVEASKSPKRAPVAVANSLLVSGAGGQAAKPTADSSIQSLGDASTDLVYVPIVPCRILDTRVAGGAFAAGETREFDVTSTSDYSPQGGSPTNCNGAGAAGAFAAAAISFTAVLPSGPGYLTAYPVGAARPLAATLDFNANEFGTVQTPVRLSQSSPANEFALYAHNATHVVADIVGYYIAPQATALQCTSTFVTQNVAANSPFNFNIPACPVSYAVTGAGCRTPGFDEANWAVNGIYTNGSGALAANCSGLNQTAGIITVEGTAQCCRVPGR